MSEIYDGRHVTLISTWSDDERLEYERAVADMDLLICGAGTRDGFLLRWYRELKNEELRVGGDIVGDLALIPIDKNGNEAAIQDRDKEFIQDALRPHPDYSQLRDLAKRRQSSVGIDKPRTPSSAKDRRF